MTWPKGQHARGTTSALGGTLHARVHWIRTASAIIAAAYPQPNALMTAVAMQQLHAGIIIPAMILNTAPQAHGQNRILLQLPVQLVQGQAAGT